MLQNSFSIIQIEISSLALSKHVEIQPEPFSSIERDLWRYALRVNQSIRRFQSLSIEENFQSSALRNELQTLENTPAIMYLSVAADCRNMVTKNDFRFKNLKLEQYRIQTINGIVPQDCVSYNEHYMILELFYRRH